MYQSEETGTRGILTTVPQQADSRTGNLNKRVSRYPQDTHTEDATETHSLA